MTAGQTYDVDQLNKVLAEHHAWLRAGPGPDTGTRRADLSGADLSEGANLSGAHGIVSFGPAGNARRIGYAVAFPDGTVMVQLGCFWGTSEGAISAIAKKYGEGSAYAALVAAATAAVLRR